MAEGGVGMTIVAGRYRFESSDYDAHSDILYLSVGDPVPGVGEVTPEGHTVTFDAKGRLVGMDLFGVRQILGRGEAVRVTLPSGEVAAVEGIEKLLKQPV